ncbi:unnamed protein product [Calypogeia fissa]
MGQSSFSCFEVGSCETPQCVLDMLFVRKRCSRCGGSWSSSPPSSSSSSSWSSSSSPVAEDWSWRSVVAADSPCNC